MNKDQAEGKRDEFTAKIKQEWGKLTDDEVTEAEGNIEELMAKIQQKYGDSREVIAKKINELKEKFNS